MTKITVDMFESARQHAHEQGYFMTEHGTGHSMRFGRLGENVFEEILKAAGKKYHYAADVHKRARYDFMAYQHGIGRTIEIKTIANPRYSKLMIPLSQWLNKPKDYYFLVYVDEERMQGRIIGYASRKFIKDRGNPATYNGNDVIEVYASELEIGSLLIRGFDNEVK